jgi:tRNA-uridine 2-sulfurtransferase
MMQYGNGRVGLALSGGADSAAAALLLREQGSDVLGVTAVLAERGDAAGAAEAGAAIAERLGIPHRVVDLRDAFRRRVLEPFAAEYARGRTPNPCACCNAAIKFGALAEAARAAGATCLATGHYARRDERAGAPCLRRGRDAARDQSYFLARLSPAQLAFARFPLGNLTKTAALELVTRHGLADCLRPPSRDCCFIGTDADGTAIDAGGVGEAPPPGEVVDTAGHVLGRHDGIHRATIGQRRGFGVAARERLYVVAIDAARNRVVLGTREEAMRDTLTADRATWFDGYPGDRGEAAVQMRYRHPAVACRLTLAEGGRMVHAVCAEPQFAVTPGQLAVFYDGDMVMGSGWICA